MTKTGRYAEIQKALNTGIERRKFADKDRKRRWRIETRRVYKSKR